jgi:hypothetical protein
MAHQTKCNVYAPLSGAFVTLRKAILALSCLSVRMEQLGSQWTTFMKFDI